MFLAIPAEALAYAFWRRYVLRPRRLEKNREALLVLTLIQFRLSKKWVHYEAGGEGG